MKWICKFSCQLELGSDSHWSGSKGAVNSSLCTIFVISHEELFSGFRILHSTTTSLPLQFPWFSICKYHGGIDELLPCLFSLFCFFPVGSSSLEPGSPEFVPDLFSLNTSSKSSCFCSKPLISKAINLLIRKGIFRDKQPQTSCSWNGFPIYHPCLYWLCVISQGNIYIKLYKYSYLHLCIMLF